MFFVGAPVEAGCVSAECADAEIQENKKARVSAPGVLHPMKKIIPKIYLDYAAATPVDPRVFRAMKPYFTDAFGNPGSLHSFGQEAIAAVDQSRETIARAIGAEFREIIFTGSATEANNLALRGMVAEWQSGRAAGTEHVPQFRSPATLQPRIIISAIEHESVLETARDLEKNGAEVVYLPVNRQGIVNLKKLEESLNERTVLVSVMYANNEIGTIQPIAEIAKVVQKFRDKDKVTGIKEEKNVPLSLSPYPCPIFHTDAAQAFQFLDCNVQNLGMDMMTLSAHKIYGPKGAGALFMKHGAGGKGKKNSISNVPLAMSPLLAGGGQEYGLRSGTENVPAIVGFAKAVELLFQCSEEHQNEGKKTFQCSEEHWNKEIAGLRDRLWRGIKKICPQAEINGVDLSANSESVANERILKFAKGPLFAEALPNILNVFFPGHAAQDLLTQFDLHGLAVSSGSACRSRAMESSYVIEALGLGQGTRDKDNRQTGTDPIIHVPLSMSRARSSLRFSLGRPTTKQEIDAALKIIKKCFEK